MQFIETIQLPCLFCTIFSWIILEFLFIVEDSGICSLPFWKHKLNPLFFNYAQSGVDLWRPFKINVFGLCWLQFMKQPILSPIHSSAKLLFCFIMVLFMFHKLCCPIVISKSPTVLLSVILMSFCLLVWFQDQFFPDCRTTAGMAIIVVLRMLCPPDSFVATVCTQHNFLQCHCWQFSCRDLRLLNYVSCCSIQLLCNIHEHYSTTLS